MHLRDRIWLWSLVGGHTPPIRATISTQKFYSSSRYAHMGYPSSWCGPFSPLPGRLFFLLQRMWRGTALDTASMHIPGLPRGTTKSGRPIYIKTFLGIELDSQAWEIHLHAPAEKLLRTRPNDHDKNRTAIGHLSHADTVVCPGRTYLRYLIEASKRQNQQTHLDAECRADLAWSWNGIPMQPWPPISHAHQLLKARGAAV